MTRDVSELLERSSAAARQAMGERDPAIAAQADEQCLVLAGRAMAALIERRVAFPFERAA